MTPPADGMTVWKASVVLDPHDPALVERARRRDVRLPGPADAAGPGQAQADYDLGDAGVLLYRDQLEAAGVHVEGGGATPPEYYIRGGADAVMIHSDRQYDPIDDDTFVIVVVPRHG
jgi:hypothetical protein